MGQEGMLKLQITEEGVLLSSTGTTGTPTLDSWVTSSEDEETGEITYTVSIRNVTGYELPSTGGNGTKLFIIIGSVLMTAAGILLVKRRRAL